MQQLKNARTEKVLLALMLLLGLTLTIPTLGASANRPGEFDKGQQKEVPQEDFLDLTRYSRPAQLAGSETQTASATIEVGGGPGVQTPELPLKITLLSLDKNSYKLGDEAFFDVTLENISKETVAIPWSPDSSIGSPFQNNERRGSGLAVLSLMVGKTSSTGQRTAAYGLYGSETVPGSLKKLEPGQRVRIRVPFEWQFFDQEAARELLKHSQHVPVRAQIFLSGRRISHLPATSANSLTVELRGQ